MSIKQNVKRLAILSVLLIATNANALPIAQLTLDSDLGDYIGQGQMHDIFYTPNNSRYFSPKVRRYLDGQPSQLQFILGTVASGPTNTFAIVSFGTEALGQPLKPGFYPDAERLPFATAGHPGMSISFQNRGCNRLRGSFTVATLATSSAAFDATGSTIETFRADFEQHCEGRDPALRGTFYYDAFGRANVPAPSTLLTSCLLLMLLRLFRQKQILLSC